MDEHPLCPGFAMSSAGVHRGDLEGAVFESKVFESIWRGQSSNQSADCYAIVPSEARALVACEKVFCSVRLLLPATLGDIPGAETQTPDIRDQPGGEALFQFWMENRRKDDERLGRDRDRAGSGGRDGVGNGAQHARSQLQLSSLATS